MSGGRPARTRPGSGGGPPLTTDRAARRAPDPRPRRLALVILLWSAMACEVVTLEPDPDHGLDSTLPRADAALEPIDAILRPPDARPDADPPDLALPMGPTLMPMELDFGEVEPYRAVERAVSLRAGRETLRVEAAVVDGRGFDLALGAPPTPLILEPGAMARWPVVFTSEIAGRDSVGELRLTTDDGVRRIPLRGRGAWSGPPCAAWTVEVEPAPPALLEPGATLLLKAKPPATVSLADVGLLWTTVESPMGYADQPLERFLTPDAPQAGGPPDDPSSFAAVLYAEKAGRYLFEAQPILPPTADCMPERARVAVHACPCPERAATIRVGWRRSADAAPGRPRIVPLLIPGAAADWSDGLSPDAPPPDWGRAGPADDPRLDLDHGDVSGRATLWIEDGPLEPVLRLGLAVLAAPDGPPTTVDLAVEVHVGGEIVAISADALEAHRSFWDVAAIVSDPAGQVRVVPYDRVLLADDGAWPDPGEPLGLDDRCDPRFGPRCAGRLRCRPAPGGDRCRL